MLLKILADGSKLPPLIIFKGKDRAKIWRELQKDQHVKNGDCIVECNENAWSTLAIMRRWYSNIWKKYLDSVEFNTEGDGYLILDKATSHLNDEFINEFTTENKIISFIPSGLTRYLQPLDVVVSRPFKNALKEVYVNYCIEKGVELVKVAKTTMIDWICKIWQNEKIITQEMIYKSFRCTGIANNLNRTEDYFFTAWKHMQEEAPLIEDDIDENINEQEISDEDDVE